MKRRPAPLVPPEVDLRDFPYMLLAVRRLRDSDLGTMASGEGFKAAMLLYCASWHQVPAGSIPSDERWLAKHSGVGAAWRKVRREALRGFVECADGRLYHPVVAERALEAWARKQAQRNRTAAARAAREHQPPSTRAATAPVTGAVTETVTGPVTEGAAGASVTETVTETVTENVTGSKVKLKLRECTSTTTPLPGGAAPGGAGGSQEPEIAKQALDYLNLRAGRSYQPVPANLKLIRARLREGATFEQIKGVVDAKVEQWRSDPERAQYLRPATLFNAEKFASYVGQLSAIAANQEPQRCASPACSEAGRYPLNGAAYCVRHFDTIRAEIEAKRSTANGSSPPEVVK